MLSTPHLLVGATIVKLMPDHPEIALPLAFLSHFVLDSIPHWDGSPQAPFSKKTAVGVVADYSLGVALVYLSTNGLPNQYLIWLGAFLATLPDFILGTYKHFIKYLEKYPVVAIPNRFHMSIQRNVTFWPGLAISATTSIICLLILIS
ncbi:MAG TPA: hypothetical protein VLE47_00600 [Candidatus Saccharimonadales bacterium]|nr:hypothetical protein [Candidatus Saccharimonadales bacterium]